jgi:hypothetical protein
VQLAPPSTPSTHFKSTHTWLAFLTIWHSNNGFGYRAHGINSPYLWSYSNQYHAGKFVSDGVYSPNRRQRTGWRDANLQVALHTRQDNQLRWQARGARRAGSRAARTNSRRLVNDVEEFVSSFVKWAKAK